jgi:large subunit ribosomal protein L29
MKAESIRKMSKEEIIKKENELREELGNLSFQHRIRPLEDTSRLRQLRKDIARIATINRENENKQV